MTAWTIVNETDRSSTYRMKVPGGWLYRHRFTTDSVYHHFGESIVFVPLAVKPKTERGPSDDP